MVKGRFDEKSLGDEFIKFHRHHIGQPRERFLRMLAKHTLKLFASSHEQPEIKTSIKKSKAK